MMRLTKPMRRALLALACALLGLLCGPLGPGRGFVASARAEEPLSQAEQYFVGNILFVFYHEVGHALIDKLQAPVLGREEDAVDQLASLVLLDMGDAVMGEPAVNAALGWLVSWQKAGERPDAAAYWDVHSLDIQRYANIMCLIYGSDPEAYADLIGADGVPPERAESCPYEYQQSATSWGAVLAPVLVGAGAAAPAKASFTLVYLAPETEELMDMFAELKEGRMLDNLADDLNASLTLDSPVELALAECGEANAYYDPETSRLTLCLELLRVFAEDADALAQAQ